MVADIIKSRMAQEEYLVKSWKPSQVQKGIRSPVPVQTMTIGILQVVIAVRVHGPKPI